MTCVLLRLPDQYLLAVVALDRGPDLADLRALVYQPPEGTVDIIDVANASRGPDVMQWSRPAWLTPPAP